MRVVVALVLAPFILATVVGLVLLWPSEEPTAASAFTEAERARGTVAEVHPCDNDAPGCLAATVDLTKGVGAPDSVEASIPYGEQAPEVEVGDRILLSYVAEAPVDQRDVFQDFDRGRPLATLLVLFVVGVLAGLVIGALGVLDDVTVTQAAVVWELAEADPDASRTSLFASGMRVGRAHVASTVNTLALAYVGATLPLLLVFSALELPFSTAVSQELVAQEIVRGLVGGLGIIAAVPLTTALAAAVAGSMADRRRVALEDSPA